MASLESANIVFAGHFNPSEIFGGNCEPFSLYKVSDCVELRAVVVGLNSGRASFSNQIDFVTFMAVQLQQAGVTIKVTSGKTDCIKANALHFDGYPSSHHSVVTLCQAAMTSGNVQFRIARGEATQLFNDATTIGCAVSVQPQKCGC